MRVWQIRNWKDYPETSQRNVLQRLITAAQYTEFGKKYQLNTLFKVKNFKDRIPVHEYQDMQPYIERMMNGEDDILWNEPIKWFAKSSGTTSAKSKFIPISKETLQDNHYQANKDVLSNYYKNFPESNLLTGKGLVVGGSHQINSLDGDIQYGDLSAVLMQNMPVWGQWLRTPELSVALLDEWEVKLEKLALITSKENVTSLAGVPTWTLILLKRILEITGKQYIKDVWPNLELYINGGVSFVPYRKQFEDIIGKPINYLEVYNASEGFFAAQERPEDEGMLLYTDHGIFYEFMTIGEYGKQFPKTIGLNEVKIGIQYALVISTTGGLWRYIVGDTIVFTNVKPYRIKVSGRLKHYINAFGEEIIIDNADAAIAAAAKQTDSIVNDYTAAPIFFSSTRNGAHEWLIEFEKAPENLNEFTIVLDKALQQVNSDYEAKRQKDIALSLPIVHTLPKNMFNEWLKQKGKVGGQHKVPRLSNDRTIVDEIKKMARIVP